MADLTSGAIDADGHVLEPPELWSRYIDPAFRGRSIRIYRRDDGAEVLDLDGRTSKSMPVGLETLGAMEGVVGKPSFIDNVPAPARDPVARVARLDRERLAKAILYPSIGLIWEAEVNDIPLAAAYARAYNRWITEFCADSGGRLVPIAHISMGDGEEAARELRRSVAAGARGAFVVPYTITNKSHAHPDYDPFWHAAEDLDVPVGIHPAAEPPAKRVHQRFDDMKRWAIWHFNVHGAQGPLQAFTALFQYGLFERFPKVKVVVLESGAGWAGYLLNRMDAVFKTAFGKGVRLKELPSFYFDRQCWISGDPDEKAFGPTIDFVGADRFFWASDYPHPDHPGSYCEDLAALVAPLSESTRRKVLYENVARAYGI